MIGKKEKPVTDQCHDRPVKLGKSDKKLGQNSSKRIFAVHLLEYHCRVQFVPSAGGFGSFNTWWCCLIFRHVVVCLCSCLCASMLFLFTDFAKRALVAERLRLLESVFLKLARTRQQPRGPQSKTPLWQLKSRVRKLGWRARPYSPIRVTCFSSSPSEVEGTRMCDGKTRCARENAQTCSIHQPDSFQFSQTNRASLKVHTKIATLCIC